MLENKVTPVTTVDQTIHNLGVTNLIIKRIDLLNTIFTDEVEYIVCKHENDGQRYFVVKPETHQCKIKLRMWNNMILDKINMTYLPINSNISTTGHKLQGAALSSLIINAWAYRYAHWTCVVLSRVKSLTNLVLNKKLDVHRNYNAKPELVRWEQNIKDTIEAKTFKDRGTLDYEKYLYEEEEYKI